MKTVVPVSLFATRLIAFRKAAVTPGADLLPYAGPLAAQATDLSTKVPVQRGFVPTHMIVIDHERYWASLHTRLAVEGKRRAADDAALLDVEGVTRQALLCLSLVGGVGWAVGGFYSFDRRSDRKRYSVSGYSHRPTVETTWLIRQALAHRTIRGVSGARLRTVGQKLDRYYRSGTWWTDRVGVALGYLWTSMTTTHGELAFVGFTMALEALVSTGNAEITHTLAERCALLSGRNPSKRLDVYGRIKKLYGVRSAIVHGRAAPRKGPLTGGSLFVSAKRSNTPSAELSQLVATVLDTIEAILGTPDLLSIIQKPQSEGKTDEEMNLFFARRLLRG